MSGAHSDPQTVNASAAAVAAAAARRVLIAEKCFLILNQAKTEKWLLAIGLSHVHTHTRTCICGCLTCSWAGQLAMNRNVGRQAMITGQLKPKNV